VRALLGGWNAWLSANGATEPANAPATSLKSGQSAKPPAKPRKPARRRRG
jgi:3-mercaptopyruvate sulfurtransferase SseA